MNVEGGLQIADVWATVRRRGKAVVVAALVVSLGAYWIAMALADEYTSYATVLVTPQTVAPELAHTGMVTAAQWADLNGDEWSDLVVATEYGPVKIFRNDSGTLSDVTDAAGLGNYRGWWASLSAGDVDNDGDMDFVATNLGLNTKYQVSVERPLRREGRRPRRARAINICICRCTDSRCPDAHSSNVNM